MRLNLPTRSPVVLLHSNSPGDTNRLMSNPARVDGDITVTITSDLREGESTVKAVITFKKVHHITQELETDLTLTINSSEGGDPRASEIRAKALAAAADLLSELASRLHA